MRRVCLTAAFVGLYAAAMLSSAEPSSAQMATTARAFLAGLTPAQRGQATFPFDGPERTHWHFVPVEMFPRKGLTIKEMSEPQRQAAHDLLKSGLSQRGYMTATAIMELEHVLNALESAQRQTAGGGRGPAIVRDSERYFFSIFGTPSTSATWGWRVEGHHVSLQFTVVNGTLVAASPSFFGSNPAEVREGPKQGLRVLGAEEDAARALLAALDEAQRQRAILSAEAPTDIQTMASPEVTPLSPVGLTADAMNGRQRELLMALIDVYSGLMAPDLAAARMARLKAAGIERIGFAWLGDTAPGQKHYYRVQGPTFLIEYDNTQNNGNHVHSVWRDFQGDFGRDLLREHLRADH
ncbi:MAG: DUF3500 domain-containing protein [Vicinamibacterales bacterium]